MADSKHGCVVIGGSQAGGRAVEALLAYGFQGPIRLIGAETWPPYERPPLSKKFLLDGMMPEELFLPLASVDAGPKVEMTLGTAATAIDRTRRQIRLADGETVLYDWLLLATGARARRTALPGHDLPGIHYLRTIDDAVSIRPFLAAGAAIIVVGGGYVGLELAAAGRARGAEVTVVEAGDTVLGRVLPASLGRMFEHLHRAQGVALLTRTSVAGFEGERRVSAVRLMDGRRLPADLVVIGIGAEPNTELAAEAGLTVDDGILTDEFGQTTDPRIYAAGDVTRHWNRLLGRHIRLEAWQNAQNQAIAVAAVICGGTAPYAEVPWFWSDQYHVNLQIVGSPAAHDDVVLRQGEEHRLSAFFLNAGRMVMAVCLSQPRDIAPARRLILQSQPVDRRRLADSSIPLRDLLRSPAPT